MNKDEKKIADFTNWLEKFLVKEYGERCKERVLGCCTCEVWRVFDELKLLEDQIKQFNKSSKVYE